MVKYDYLIVGSGITGCICANELKKRGKKILVIDKRKHIGGNCYISEKDTPYHPYGPHIFHTNNEEIWNYVNDISPLIPYNHKVIACNNGLQYSMPINQITLLQLFEGRYQHTPQNILPQNFEEAAINSIGKELYELLFKYYTEKHWGMKATELPANIFSRLPIRSSCNTSYFNDKYIGVFKNNDFFDRCVDGCDIKLNTSFSYKKHYNLADRIIYTGPIDELNNYKLGELPYRSLKFIKKKISKYDTQGTFVMNYTDNRPYTRTCEYGYMYNYNSNERIYEYPFQYKLGSKSERYYPIPIESAQNLYTQYLSITDDKFIMAGRLGSYKYINMDQAIINSRSLIANLIS